MCRPSEENLLSFAAELIDHQLKYTAHHPLLTKNIVTWKYFKYLPQVEYLLVTKHNQKADDTFMIFQSFLK